MQALKLIKKSVIQTLLKIFYNTFNADGLLRYKTG